MLRKNWFSQLLMTKEKSRYAIAVTYRQRSIGVIHPSKAIITQNQYLLNLNICSPLPNTGGVLHESI